MEQKREAGKKRVGRSRCTECGAPVVCRRCLAGEGGRATAEKHAGKHAEWGKLGGRPKKKKP